ncbi:MAG: hypothetical protein R2731_16955 [Nocardioides sp.]
MGLSTAVSELPEPSRSMIVGALVLGAVGGVVGLVVGLVAYPPTAWFAVLEIGVPAGMLGGLGGLVVGAIRAGSWRTPRGRSPR